MGVKRQHTFEVVGADRFLEQYVATYENVICLNKSSVNKKILDYCDEHFPDDDWDWHFKIIGAITNRKALNERNTEVEGCISFRNKRDAFDFWWWYQQQDL